MDGSRLLAIGLAGNMLMATEHYAWVLLVPTLRIDSDGAFSGKLLDEHRRCIRLIRLKNC